MLASSSWWRAELSLSESNNPNNLPPSPHPMIIQLISPPDKVFAVGAVITIYLSSSFHYSCAAKKPKEKCYVMIYGGYMTCSIHGGVGGFTRCDDAFRNGLWVLLSGDFSETTHPEHWQTSASPPRFSTQRVTSGFPSNYEGQWEENLGNNSHDSSTPGDLKNMFSSITSEVPPCD